MLRAVISGFLIACAGTAAAETPRRWDLLDPRIVASYTDRFAADDSEDVQNAIPNSQAAEWIATNAPLFECPAKVVEQTYYFRWWTYRKHVCQTPDGRVLTEFLTPVSHAGPYNTIACATGHHLAEGRWLVDRALLDEYIDFWLTSGPDRTPAPHLHKFSGWLAAAIYERALVTGDLQGATRWLDALVADYHQWEVEQQRPDGLFWQYDVRDGMEESISGSRREPHVRPTINSYMVANARAIARLASIAGRDDLVEDFTNKADTLQALLIKSLWNEDDQFFEVRRSDGQLSQVREQIGYIPWMFDIPTREHAVAWEQLTDHEGFWAPRGLTTAEQRHPDFRTHGTGTCEWDGAVWPFATSQTLTALARLLRGPQQPYVDREDYFEQLLIYAQSHRQAGVPYLGEYHDHITGAWLITGSKAQRSRYYNHSTFNDLVINGLVGIVPREDETLVVDPLVPADAWAWFCLDGVPYHGHHVTVIWDRTGLKYNRGAGLSVLIDHESRFQSPHLTRCELSLADKGAEVP